MPGRTSSCRFPTDVGISTVELADRYRHIWQTRMHGLNFLNPQLEVECAGFRDDGEHSVGVLITPWFMNLVLLPDSDTLADFPQGEQVQCQFPSGPCDLTVYQDEELGTYLAAVLFRTVADFPDQAVARAVAEEALANILAEPPEKDTGTVSRRGLITGLKAS